MSEHKRIVDQYDEAKQTLEVAEEAVLKAKAELLIAAKAMVYAENKLYLAEDR